MQAKKREKLIHKNVCTHLDQKKREHPLKGKKLTSECSFRKLQRGLGKLFARSERRRDSDFQKRVLSSCWNPPVLKELYTLYGKLRGEGIKSHTLPLQEIKLSWNYTGRFQRISFVWIKPDWVTLLVNGQRANNWIKKTPYYNGLRKLNSVPTLLNIKNLSHNLTTF